MANELQSLNLLFQNKLFRIPDYQRGYAWLRPHLVDFWEDLLNLQVDHYHYTGMLSLKELKRKDIESWGTDLWMLDKDFKPCHIVDGQQRITTFIILLNEIISFVRSAKENIGKSDDEIVLGCTTLKEVISKYICQVRPPQNLIKTYLFGYENDNPSSEYLKYKIFNEPFSGTINETYYTKNLKIAKEFFRDNIQALYDAEGIDAIDAIYLKLTQKLMFNIHDIKDDYDVFVAFETMNNRGKKLTNLELLKNRLIYLTTLYSDDIFDEYEKKDLRNQINDTWKEVYYQLGRNELIPLSDDEFLRAHWIIYFSYSRRKGDDYIKFLLNKFSAKNIFEKIVVSANSETDFENNNENDIDEITEDEDNNIEPETITVTKLAPKEISDYINSLKDMAKYWYDTYFPQQSPHLTNEEKIWVDKLNRIGIGHFRPLVAVIISLQQELPENKIKAFQAIERFIFIFFRMGYYNASYRSSEYYRMTRSLYFGEIRLDDFIQDIEDITSSNVELVIPPFIAKIEKHFKDADGYYSWNTIKYFLYEYEFSLAQKNNIDKVTWEMFTKSEKDKISIEHIFPQTPTKYYWRNMFRQFDKDEQHWLAGALGNLLPLSQSINSSLQNDSFDDKKSPKNGRRGYENGSHSEIELSKEPYWDAKRIYDRSKSLLQFMENRWQFSLTKEQFDKLIYINFVNDEREIPPELPEEINDSIESFNSSVLENILEKQQLEFWTNFVGYCKNKNRDDIVTRKPYGQNWYDIIVGAQDFHLSFTLSRNKYITILIYSYNIEAFRRLEQKKNIIENAFGDKFDWYSSRERSTAKRILYRRECDIFNIQKQPEIFEWMIEHYDKLCSALSLANEISE